MSAALVDRKIQYVIDRTPATLDWTPNQWGGADVNLNGATAVRLTPNDGDVELLVFDRHVNLDYKVVFEVGTPLPIVLGMVKVALSKKGLVR